MELREKRPSRLRTKSRHQANQCPLFTAPVRILPTSRPASEPDNSRIRGSKALALSFNSDNIFR